MKRGLAALFFAATIGAQQTNPGRTLVGGDTTFGLVPQRAILLWAGRRDSIPQGFQRCDGTNGTPNLYGRFLKAVADSATNPGSTGGSATASYTPEGTVAAPVFTGTGGQTTSATSGGTPAGTNNAPALTMNAYTPAGTVAASIFTGTAITTVSGSKAGTSSGAFSTIGGAAPGSSFTPAGTNSAPAFTGSSATLTGSVAAPTFMGSALATHTHTLTPAGTNAAPAFAGTLASIATEPSYYTVLFICKK